MVVSKGKDSDGDIKMIDVSGVKALADILAVNGSLTSLNLLRNVLDVESAGMLLKIKAEKPTLHTLCGLTHEETQLNFAHQGLGPGDAMLLAPEISVMGSLTSLILDFNSIGDEGAKEIAKGLSANGSLTELTLWNNNLDESAKSALRAAARPALKLHLN